MSTRIPLEDLHEASKALKKLYSLRVPNGEAIAARMPLGYSQSLVVRLVGNINDQPSRIPQNDIGYGQFCVSESKDERYQFELSSGLAGHQLSINPTEKHMAMSFKGAKFRKIKAKNIDDLIAKFDKYLMRFLTMVLDEVEAQNVYRQERYDSKYFQFNMSPLKQLLKEEN